jgi:transmembrane sensor
MNSSNLTPDSTVEAEAALWAAKLDGSAISESELAEFDAWLAKDPARQVLLVEFLGMSTNLDEQLPALVAAGAVTMPATPNRARRQRRLAFIAAACGTLAAAALVIWLVLPMNGIQTVTTPAGQRDSVTLSDGSRVELNAGTSVSIENTRTERRVQLSEGEAYFVVKKNAARPFIVYTSVGSVRVTGTIFDVRTEPGGELEVTVVEGNVQVRLTPTGGVNSSTATLRAGDSLSVQSGDLSAHSALSATALDDALAWRQGMVVFDGVPIRELAERYARYNGRKIAVTPTVANLKMGGRYALDDLPGFYAAIGQAFPDVRVATSSDGAARIGLVSDP